MDINKYTPLRKGTHSIFKSEENGCVHIGRNVKGHTIRHFQVDKGIFPQNDPQERCDYLLLNDTDKRAYYIELKGSDLEKAIRQIDNTIKLLHPGISTYTVFPRIVYFTGTHDVRGSKVTKWKAKYRQRVIIRSRKIEEDIS